MVLSVVVGLLLGLTIHAFIRCTRCAAPAAPPMGGAASPAASVMVSAVGAAPRRAATLTSLWLGAKLALVAAERAEVAKARALELAKDVLAQRQADEVEDLWASAWGQDTDSIWRQANETRRKGRSKLC